MAITDQELAKIGQSFASRLKRMPNGCLEWTGSRTKQGYGVIGRKRGNIAAHRVAYALAHGGVASLGKGMHVRHSCDNPPCCDDEHLVLGTPEQNVQDAHHRRRNATGERYPGAKLTDDAVRDIRRGDTSFEHVCAMMIKYRVSEGTVRNVLARKFWKHVE